MIGTLEKRNGWLYAVLRAPMYNEPTMVINWYPLRIKPRDVSRDAIGQKMDAQHDSASFIGREDGLRYRLPQGGKTRPEFTETEPIPPPKRCKQVRYMHGRWEKYTRATGWTPA